MKKTKRILTLLLAAVLCLSLFGVMAGCSKKETPDPANSAQPGGGGSSGGRSGGSGRNSGGSGTPAPDTYVYTSKLVPLKGDMAKANGMNAVAYRDGRILASAYVKLRDEIPEGVTPEWEDQYAVYGTKLFWVDMEGNIQELTGYEPLPMDGEGPYMSGGTYMMSLRITPEGKLVSMEERYTSTYTGPDDVELYTDEWYQKEYYQYMEYKDEYFVRFLGEDGTEEGIVDLSAVIASVQDEGGYFYPNYLAVDQQGRVYICGSQMIIVMDAEGSELKRIQSDSWFESMVCLNDGRVCVAYYGDTGEVLAALDPVTLEIDKDQTYPVTNAWNLSVGGGDYDFYYTNGSNLMGYKLETGKAEKVFNWINADVDPSNVNMPFVTEDGKTVLLQTEWSGNNTEAVTSLVTVSRVPASSVEQKTVLTLACMYLDWNTQRMIVQFNRSNPDFRIELLDYSEYNTEEDYSAGQTKLNTEIMSGKVPDILNLSGLSAGKLAAKGILADLTPYLDADEELKGQIFENVLDALRSEGKIYRTASGFNVNTVMGAASVVGDTPGWTLEQYNAALKSMPKGCEPFSQGMTRDSILSWGLSLEMNRLVDWSTGKCAFDTPAFTDILKLAAQFPKDFDYENMEWEEETERIASGRQMLMQVWLSDFESIQMYDAIFGGDATYIGFPTSEGVGSMLQFNDEGYAISAKCPYKDAAWQFLREMLTSKYQEENVWAFPTNRVAFEKKLKEAMTPQYMMDDKGNYILDENGEKIEQDRGTWGWGSLEIRIKALTQAQADKVMELIEGATRVANYDEELTQIITAECEAFFAGQKSAEDVGRLLQSKMTIYVNEQR